MGKLRQRRVKCQGLWQRTRKVLLSCLQCYFAIRYGGSWREQVSTGNTKCVFHGAFFSSKANLKAPYVWLLAPEPPSCPGENHHFHQRAAPCNCKRGNPDGAENNSLKRSSSVISKSRTTALISNCGCYVSLSALKIPSGQRCKEGRTISCHRQWTMLSRVKAQCTHPAPLQSCNNYCKTETLWFEIFYTHVVLL